MTDRHVIITAAGNAERFTRLGISTPKWALTVQGKPLLQWSLDSLGSHLDTAHVSIVVQDQHRRAMTRLLHTLPCRLPITLVTSPPGPRQGQARDAVHAITAQMHLAQQATIVWNIDTILLEPPGALPHGHWLHLAELPGPHWSFAAMDDAGHVQRTAEKHRISRWASTGLYGFASGHTLLSLTAAHAHERGELYVAPLYNDLIIRGERVQGITTAQHTVAPCGTPEQVVDTARAHQWELPAELTSGADTSTRQNTHP